MRLRSGGDGSPIGQERVVVPVSAWTGGGANTVDGFNGAWGLKKVSRDWFSFAVLFHVLPFMHAMQAL